MRLIKPGFKIEDERAGRMDNTIVQAIERAGRTCYKSGAKIKKGTAVKFVGMILDRGHESVLEHEKVTVRIICDRGVSHEIVRHRIASYSQESTRYCDYAGGHITFILPPWLDWVGPEGELFGEPAVIEIPSIDNALAGLTSAGDIMWVSAMWEAEGRYKALRKEGWKPEQARAVLPNSLKTEIVMTCNLREWRHFFKLRTATAAHPQMREIAVPMLAEFQRLIPVVFDDIKPKT